MKLREKVEKIKKKEMSAVENVLSFSKKIASKESKELNIFLSLNEKAIEEAKRIDEMIEKGEDPGKLAGLCFAVKSNISVKGLETNCASKVLEGYVSPYNASVIDKLLSEGAIILGMTNMDEFACGVSGETSAFGPTKNPTNKELIPGGSSSGSAAAVSADLCDFALGTDTGGSIRNPASHCGVVGLKPTYGAVSRYGLIDLAMSFDCIGVLSKNSEDAKFVFEIMRGQDNFDQSTKEYKEIFDEIKTIGLVNVEDFCDEKIAKIVSEKTKEIAKKNGWKIKNINLPLDIALQTYFITVYTEFFSATRKFDGRRFGKRIEEFAGPEVLRRILGGSEITKAEHSGKYYREAIKAKNYIKEKFEEIFKDVDLIVLPTIPKTPHKIGENLSVEELYNYDVLTTPASIAEVPAISIPVGKIDNKEVGVQIIAPKFGEKRIFKASKEYEK